MQTWTVVIIDNHPISRSGLKIALREYPQFNVIGEASNGEDGINVCNELKPDIVTMDINMPGTNGIDATAMLREQFPDMIIIGLSGYMSPNIRVSILRAGADGFISKETEFHDIIQELQQITEKVARIDDTHQPDLFQLTTTEQHVLSLLAGGNNRRQIADELKISINTVKMHLKNLYSKLNAKSSNEALDIAIKHHLIP